MGHTPGRDHNRKSKPKTKARDAKRRMRLRQVREDEARRRWQEWDGLNNEQKKLVPKPDVPRPQDDN